MKLELEGSEALKRACDITPTKYFGQQDFIKFGEEMYTFMRKNNGIGLATPQINSDFRMFVMGDKNIVYYCVNPELIAVSLDTSLDTEGCLSYPGLRMKVKRPQSIKVRFNDLDGNVHEKDFDALWARCFQHELDHLNGITFVDKVGKTKLQLARKKQKKIIS